MIPQKDIEAVLDIAKVQDLAEERTTLIQKGPRLVGCCPFHSEKTGSFTVDPHRNRYKCFGCGESGDAISFVRKDKNMSFTEAVKYLAERYHVKLEGERPMTPEETMARKKKEAMLDCNKAALEFYVSNLNGTVPGAEAAKAYAVKRWGAKIIEEEQLGFSPGRGMFLAWAKKRGLSMDLLLELGLIKRSKKGVLYDNYSGRLVMPIMSRLGDVVGFTARCMTEAKNTGKYINSDDSIIFKKGEIVYGLNAAYRAASKEELIYLVEGAPDVMRLHAIGIYNVVAPLGTAWTEKHFAQLKRYNVTLCFIPDTDKIPPGELYGAGIKGVLKAGAMAMREGFRVIVKEIRPPKRNGNVEKADPDSFITSKSVLDAIPKEDFIPWFTAKKLLGRDTTGERSEILKEVAVLMAKVTDKDYLKILTNQIKKVFNLPISIIQNAINEQVNINANKIGIDTSKLLDHELYQKFGFFERNNCYYALGKNGSQEQWSNFKLEPLFHIKDVINAKRLFKITNVDKQSEIIELKANELVSLQLFKVHVASIGNYVWMAGDSELTKLTLFLYSKTETAVEIQQLGWQPQEFFAFGNGILNDGEWLPTDDYGVVRVPKKGNYYLPGASVIYANERKIFQFERRFIHTTLSAVQLRQVIEQMIKVFGDNARIGFCFLLATLFKDIITIYTKNFPILNLFEPKGSGKSELGHTLMSFFIINNDPPNLSSATDAALAEAVAQCANALVHVDEYKNTIELNRREFIKGLYDGVGRTRMNMDRDKKREMTAVDCGVIMSGQEMPTIDIAIFSRVLFLCFNKTSFSTEEGENFEKLKQMRDAGFTHITLDILRHRKRVSELFGQSYKQAFADLSDIMDVSIEARILRNWTVPLAIFRTLESALDMPFSYNDMLKTCASHCKEQNSQCHSTNEVSTFWGVIEYLHQNGDLLYDVDYRIKSVNKLKCRDAKDAMEFKSARKILYLSTKRAFMLYKKNARSIGTTPLPDASLRYYLEISPEFLGIKSAVRFKSLPSSADAVRPITSESGDVGVQRTSRVDWALCFDYELLSNNTSINLELDSTPFEE